MKRALQLAGLLVIVGGLQALQRRLGIEGARAEILAMGLILLAGYLGGEISERLRLPRITGYLLVGLIIGPSVLALLEEEMLAALQPINGIAVSLIALTAGMELRVAVLRKIWRTLVYLTAGTILVPFILVVLPLLLLTLLAAYPAFLAGEPLRFVVTVAMVFGALAVASSPTVAIAVINESRSQGPLTTAVLGVTVLKDIVVIVLFATTLAFSRPLLDPGRSFDLGFLQSVGVEIFGSILVGTALGWVVSLIMGRVRREAPLFVLGLALLISEASLRFHLEPLLVSLLAGFFMENLSSRDAEPILEGIEASSFPIYAVFFALAGASLHLHAFLDLWPLILTLVGLRAGGIWLGAYLGARWAGAEEVVRRYGWMGLLSQAGVTLALSVILVRVFPDWGGRVQTIIVGLIAVHELVGPLVFQYALAKAGEIGQREEAG